MFVTWIQHTKPVAAGAKILGDTQGRQWLVKAPNNPQGKRIRANEYVAAALGARIGAVMQLGSVGMVGEDVAATGPDVGDQNGDPHCAEHASTQGRPG
jgi:hypothetical protein